MRRAAGTALLAGALLVLAPVVAAADAVDDAVSSLRTHHVFVANGAEGAGFVDGAKLAGLIGSSDIRIAVLPASASGNTTAQETVQRLQAELGDASDVVIGIVGRKISVAAGANAPVNQDDGALIVSNAYGRHSDGGFTKANVEGALEDIVNDVNAAAAAAGRPTSTATGSGDGGHGAAVAGFFVVLGIGAVLGGMWLGLRRRAKQRRHDEVASARADVESLYNRLGSDVSTLAPGDDKVAQQAMADASERYASTGATLSSATTVGELAAARRSAIEGIQAARVVRKRLGLDEGPDPQPLAPASAPQVQGTQQVSVGDQSYIGHGAYTPGSPYYFGGGTYGGSWVPGGWYPTPFWEQLLITEAVFGGFGGWSHGGYDAGYDDGRAAGQDAAYDAGQSAGWAAGHDSAPATASHGWGGGDWGSGHGSSWGDDSQGASWGGGDWGGGGDSGGGGGDGGGSSW